ncbi:cytochrome P450 4c3-like [Pollicipes pollicipes]|uniref:cytochrome P450 4c3-like n=1 Tax=Pollicipes pollicipes TaxID=41117 RepID=UPI0018853F64|nr:cytochrome P450 4c3-like [Pollicipes pollicipes]
MALILSHLIEACSPYIPVLIFLVAIAVLLGDRSQRAGILRKIPGPPAYPLLGSLPDMPRNTREIVPVMRRLCERFPGVMHTSLGSIHYVVVSSAEAAEPVLSSKRFLDKGIDYGPVRPWLGLGLLTSTGDKWHTHRKLITPAFHFAVLEPYLEVMNECSGALVRRLRAAGTGFINVWPFISDATLDVICETAMGVNLSFQSGSASEYKAALQTMGNIIHMKSLRPWLRNDSIFWLLGWKHTQDKALNFLHSFTQSVIRERKMLLKEGMNTPSETPSRKRLAFLDLLLSSAKNGALLTDEEIREEVDTFMFEGHDTTSSGITWALFNIGRMPEVQRKIHDELDEVMAGRDTPPTRDDLAQMKYLEWTIKESMRVCPPVTTYSRTLPEAAQILGYDVPAGTDVLFFPHMIHRDPRHWADPDRFEPERFQPERSAGRHPYSYLPFSAGPRNCIGQRFALMEEKAVISAVLREFRVESRRQYDESMMNVCLTLQSNGPVEVRFVPRDRE